jgi:hypothetical protein
MGFRPRGASRRRAGWQGPAAPRQWASTSASRRVAATATGKCHRRSDAAHEAHGWRRILPTRAVAACNFPARVTWNHRGIVMMPPHWHRKPQSGYHMFPASSSAPPQLQPCVRTRVAVRGDEHSRIHDPTRVELHLERTQQRVVPIAHLARIPAHYNLPARALHGRPPESG